MTDTLSEQRMQLFGVEKSIRYHQSRRKFFRRQHWLIRFLTLLFGTAAVATVLASQLDESNMLIIGAAVAALAIFDLVVRSSERAQGYHELARRFMDLKESIVVVKEPTKEELTTWRTARQAIEKDEPPILHVLNCIMHNEVIRAKDLDRGYMATIRWYQRLFAQICDVRFSSIEEKRHTGD